MVPWRLAHGERLYRDVHFHHGPLGPYLAAITDGLAGRSLPARTGLYALVALLHVAALDRLARAMLSPWRAALATSTAIAAAVFLWPGGWLFPFSFDTALAVAAPDLGARARRRVRDRPGRTSPPGSACSRRCCPGPRSASPASSSSPPPRADRPGDSLRSAPPRSRPPPPDTRCSRPGFRGTAWWPTAGCA